MEQSGDEGLFPSNFVEDWTPELSKHYATFIGKKAPTAAEQRKLKDIPIDVRRRKHTHRTHAHVHIRTTRR